MPVMILDIEYRSSRIGAQIHLRNGRHIGEATAEFDFEWSAQDQEDLRWYLEDYLTYPIDPAPQIATRIETRISKVGDDLFTGMFRSSAEAAGLWKHAVKQLETYA